MSYNILFKEGIINYYKRKRNITYLDSKTVYSINYRNKTTKIVLNRKFGYVDMMIFKNGIYEKETIDDIFNSLNPDKVLLDIGSNIGQHSLLLAPYCKKIFAFEPIKQVYDQFNESIKYNNYKNIETFNIGISDKKDAKNFNFVKNHAGTSSFIERDNTDIVENITVHTDTLSNVLGNTKIDVMKIDVEGFEAVVVLGNKDFILKNNPILFLEFSPHWIKKEGTFTASELFYFFIDNQFEIYSRNSCKILSRNDLDIERQDNWIIKPIS